MAGKKDEKPICGTCLGAGGEWIDDRRRVADHGERALPSVYDPLTRSSA